ncbi:MAG TPA: hypothetical protein ENG77_05720 [Chromatiales bacterium]|nr:hypothetical protein [Chromatiales bacterium]
MTWFATAFAALAASIVAAWISPARARSWAGGCAFFAASGLVFVAGVEAISTGGATFSLGPLSLLEPIGFVLNPLRGLFLIVTAVVFLAATPLLVRDAAQYPRHRAALFLTLVAILYAGMLAFFTAADIVSFVFFWEISALAIWGLVTFHSREARPVAAGYLTLMLSEAGTLAGMAGLFILASHAHSTALSSIAAAGNQLPAGALWIAFLLTFFGFGVKAGIVPVNAWLPEAHGSAPRSVSPILSGATLNLGVFALFVIDGPIAIHHPQMALLVLFVGAVTALTGIVYALTERDLKRLLAQSSIENLGIVVAALGAGFAFVSLGHPVLGAMALVAGLYHMLNHSAYKTLLFVGAAGIDQATGTHDLDRLGGLMRRMPVFATAFLIGALAIAALPPFNGFVSEWLLFESLLRVVEIASQPVRAVFALSGAMLALTVGLAMTCFVMLAGSALLGRPRSEVVAAAAPAPVSATIPMWGLVVVCFGLGVLATAVIPLLGGLVRPLAGANPTAALVPAFFGTPHGLPAGLTTTLSGIGAEVGRGVLPLRSLVVVHSGGAATPVVFAMSTALAFAVIALLLLSTWGATRLLHRRRTRRVGVWDAGLPCLQPQMGYTATAFSAPVRVLFESLLRPVVQERQHSQGGFILGLERETRVVHLVDRLFLNPVAYAVKAIGRSLAWLHQGAVTLYATWVLATLFAALMAMKFSL